MPKRPTYLVGSNSAMRSAHTTYLTNAAKARIMAATGACTREARTALKRVARARIAAARAAREVANA